MSRRAGRIGRGAADRVRGDVIGATHTTDFLQHAAGFSPEAEHALAEFIRGERVAVLAMLIREARGDFDAAEDALAEAVARAVHGWRAGSVPDRPGAWILTTARRILIDRARSARAASERVRRESARATWNDAAADTLADASADDSADAPHDPVADMSGVDLDDRLALLFTCCHPALSRLAQLALALRTIAGLNAREIARAFLEPEATTAQRLVRATRKIRDAGIPYRIPSADELPARVDVAREAIYLVFNEGFGATEGSTYLRPAMSEEAIRLARLLVSLDGASPESLGLLALMLLHHARRDARVNHVHGDGTIVPLEEQDRARFDAEMIREGEHLLDRAMHQRRPGPYQLQAAIAALHATAATAADTDWRQIAQLYGALRLWMPTPVVELNAAVALAMVHGPEWGLTLLDALASERGMADYHLLRAARADLLRRAARYDEAAVAYVEAIACTRSDAERRYLERRLREVEER